MDITVHVYHHVVAGSADPRLDIILAQQESIMAGVADIKAKLDDLASKVAAEETVIDSAVAAFNGLAAIIADLKSQLANAILQNDPAQIKAVADQLDALAVKVDADKQKLGDAVTANTPQS